MAKKSIIKFDQVEDLIIELRGNQVLIDADVAALYQVETKEINQAVKNNPRKFPKGYVFTTTDEETELVKNFDRFANLKHSTVRSGNSTTTD